MSRLQEKPAAKWSRKDLLELREMSAEEILLILDTARSFREVTTRAVKKVPALRGKTVAILFSEPSTRTRISFELAAKRLSADIISVQTAQSSLVKGESLHDTARNIEAMRADILVVRHGASGVPHQLARVVSCSIVNGGDGSHEHPTQALLDLFTIREHIGHIEGLKVSIIGDIAHSRVARSNIAGMTKLGAKVTVCGPPTLIPRGIEQQGVDVTYDVHEAIEDADVIYVLRLQLERQDEGLFPSIREYAATFGINSAKMQRAKPTALVMHPGPINRGIELSPDVADGSHSVILEQVTNGIAVRMACLYLIAGVKAGE
ncbi:MAG: aspartate carbamoyltransferase catalytic subunit [Candidatus Omnitrophica bacterium]|nr:aspartate carbamoyltransferase catalytic subunit [Candidatus Omnitrophota bacterium]